MMVILKCRYGNVTAKGLDSQRKPHYVITHRGRLSYCGALSIMHVTRVELSIHLFVCLSYRKWPKREV